MRRNTNPSTLREMSGADGNFLRRLHPMSMDGVLMFDKKPKFLRESRMDGTKNKRRLLGIPNRCASVRLSRDLYAFCILNFMSSYQVDYEIYTDVFTLNEDTRRIYNKKARKEPLREMCISYRSYRRNLNQYCRYNSQEYIQREKFKLYQLMRGYYQDFC